MIKIRVESLLFVKLDYPYILLYLIELTLSQILSQNQANLKLTELLIPNKQAIV